jgi:nanoRNase/pAp phosphatase (c-di-AMP/oligoRNAs hydrolase)
LKKVSCVSAEVVIVTHKNTDFDALASSVAASLLYKNSVITMTGSLNSNVSSFLSIHKEVINYVEVKHLDLNVIDTLIIVDTGVWGRLGKIAALRECSDITIIIWDHHVNSGDIEASWKCCEQVGATITLLVRELIKNQIKITPVQATLFLLGIYEDTGNLTFTSSTSEDAYIIGYLLKNKADLNVVNKFLQPVYGEKQKDVFFNMLKKSTRMKINEYSVGICRLKLRSHVDNLASVIRMYRNVINVDAAFGLFLLVDKKKNSKCIVIGRSNNEGLNIGLIMKDLGGGGHAGAGSAILKSVDIKMIQRRLIELISQKNIVSVLVKDIMSYPVLSITSDITVGNADKIMMKYECTGMPVIDDSKLVGIISRRDCNKARFLSKEDLHVKAFMSRDVKVISPKKTPLQAVRIMMKHDIGRLLVVDNNKILGILTLMITSLYKKIQIT